MNVEPETNFPRAVYIHNPRMRGRYTTVFSCCGTPLSCSIVPCCHSSGRLTRISPIANSSGRLWAHIPHGTSKGCHGDAHALWYNLICPTSMYMYPERVKPQKLQCAFQSLCCWYMCIGMAVCRQDRAYKDYTSNPILLYPVLLYPACTCTIFTDMQLHVQYASKKASHKRPIQRAPV